MTLKTTRWYPDTCDCILEYQWDDEVQEDSRTHTPTNIVQKCTAHQTLPNNTNTIYDTINEENPRKNKALDEILQNAPSTAWYDIDATNGTRKFKNGIGISWTWSGTAPNRTMSLSFSGITLTTQQRSNLQTRLNNRFGVGKVTLV